MAQSQAAYDFHEVGRLPAPDDNVAIATRRLDAGTVITYEGQQFALDYTVLEGHRFAIAPIAPDEPLLSWGLHFGYALKPIAPGNYCCNAKIIYILAGRQIDFALPTEANFRDNPLLAFPLDPATFVAGEQVPRYPAEEMRTFEGYRRAGGRGVGTRNHIVVLAVTSRTSSWAKALEERFKNATDDVPNFDGVVAVAHTEGGADKPNNIKLLHRTLAGFVIHPNMGAVLVVDDGIGAVTGRTLRRYLQEQGYPLDHVLHRFVTLRGSFSSDLDLGAALIREWLPQVSAARRTPEPVSELKLGLQCGGSDAFSGISGNPLAAWVAKEIIRYGGAANLAETDELIGAEEYVLQNVRDLATAQKFLAQIERFKERVGWHGHTAEGNPSGGNNYRGLYNIALKSLGAATKKHPDVRLDYVIEYSELMRDGGYYFMDSPGNDLESIAGQVASGSNLMYFVTGNGSITNFPFVPTVKIVTTTGRYELLSRDMDVNAGRYLDGVPMDEVGADTLDLTLRVASGERSVGERAGHAQVSIWRNWRQTGPGQVERIQSARPHRQATPGQVALADSDPLAEGAYAALVTGSGTATDQIGLVLPTSLCAGQIAQRIANHLNARKVGRDKITRFVALPHTEGCGVSSGNSEELYARTLIGHLLHPLVGPALLLEHGCEKTHNDYIRHELEREGVDLSRFGWASIQLDGGIEAVVEKTSDWFAATIAASAPTREETVGLGALRVGLASLARYRQTWPQACRASRA
ncbi:MAG: UxaA family hydrolase [Thermomicrobiales bacterium]